MADLVSQGAAMVVGPVAIIPATNGFMLHHHPIGTGACRPLR